MIRSIICTLLLLPMMVFSLGPKVNIRSFLSSRSVFNRGVITCGNCPVVSLNTTDNAVNVCSILHIETWNWHFSMIRVFPSQLARVKWQIPLLFRTLPANIILRRDKMTSLYWNGARVHFTGYSRLSIRVFIREWTSRTVPFLPPHLLCWQHFGCGNHVLSGQVLDYLRRPAIGIWTGQLLPRFSFLFFCSNLF